MVSWSFHLWKRPRGYLLAILDSLQDFKRLRLCRPWSHGGCRGWNQIFGTIHHGGVFCNEGRDGIINQYPISYSHCTFIQYIVWYVSQSLWNYNPQRNPHQYIKSIIEDTITSIFKSSIRLVWFPQEMATLCYIITNWLLWLLYIHPQFWGWFPIPDLRLCTVELPASLRVTAKDALRKVLLEIVGEWWELTFYRHHLGIVYIYILPSGYLTYAAYAAHLEMIFDVLNLSRMIFLEATFQRTLGQLGLG